MADPATLMRVLVLPPTSRDGQVTHALLTQAGVACVLCSNIHNLVEEVNIGAAAVLLTEEATASDGVDELLRILEGQPPWSELPIVVLMREGVLVPRAAAALKSFTNVTLLERPAPMRSVISAIQTAVRGRQRQYQIRDQIEELRRAEQERERLLESERAARAEAERANRMKDEFLATLSHELRTPLNAILGWAQLLAHENPDPQDVKQGIETIARNARVQTQLIEDLLDMSRIMSGKIRLDVQTIDPAGFIDAAIETVRPAAHGRDIRISKMLDPSAGPIVGDPSRLQQVIWNLLSNAIKFTPKGGRVQVVATRVNSQVEVSVSDTGQGIKPEFLPHVFERFRQADSSITRQHGGLGLGLAIVKQLIEFHGGTVRAESPGENQGATFTVSLPLAIVHREKSTTPRVHPGVRVAEATECRDTSLAGLRVLVVDDEPDARELIHRVLRECKAEVITAGSADEAVRLVEHMTPDVLVSDIGMPNVDGYELLRRVRALGPEKGGKVPAIALTAFARSEDRTRALLAGYLVHVSKPVESAELVATIASVAGRTGLPEAV